MCVLLLGGQPSGLRQRGTERRRTQSWRFVAGEETDRFRVALDGTKLVLRNTCNGGQFPQGMLNWGTGIFLVIMVSLISFYLLAREVRSDEDKYVLWQ